MDVTVQWKETSRSGVERTFEFVLSRRASQPRWFVKPQPGLPRQNFQPEPEDWERLMQVVSEQAARGRLSPSVVQRLERFNFRRATLG